jgi:hypothetical protein
VRRFPTLDSEQQSPTFLDKLKGFAQALAVPAMIVAAQSFTRKNQ